MKPHGPSPAEPGEQTSEVTRRRGAGALNYLFKSLDLIPDGIDDIGYLDDAFVLRVAAAQIPEGESLGEAAQAVARLREDAVLIREFLGPIFPVFEKYVMNLGNGAARGRTVDEVLQDEQVRESLLADVKGFSNSYEVPSFTREEKTLVKLRSFFESKLRA